MVVSVPTGAQGLLFPDLSYSTLFLSRERIPVWSVAPWDRVSKLSVVRGRTGLKDRTCSINVKKDTLLYQKFPVSFL